MSKKHTLLMIACCLIPVVAVGAIFLFKLPVSSAVWVFLMLLCPLSHMFMMKSMGHDHGGIQPQQVERHVNSETADLTTKEKGQ